MITFQYLIYHLRCDDKPDCKDGSDEDFCPLTTTTRPPGCVYGGKYYEPGNYPIRIKE